MNTNLEDGKILTDNKIPYKRLIKILELVKANSSIEEDKLDISFEFLMASCFPTIYQSIKDEFNRIYTKGYLQGLNDKKNN